VGLVNTGLFGTRSTFVPIAQATATGDDVQVPYEKQLVKDAPNMDPDGHLSEEEEQQLWRHYSMDYDTGDATDTADRDRVGVDDDVQDSAVGRDTSGPTTDQAMTRSEEELRVGTQTRETGRVRLRKYVTTEQQQVTVPGQREEVRVEVDGDQQAYRDADIDRR
jgi:stress response protein YsnF